MKILLVEDNEKMAKNIKISLESIGYEVFSVFDGKSGIEFEKNQIGIVILDLSLPDIDGLEVCKKIRDSGFENPILMLTARIDINSKVEGLDCGADDYLTKPFVIDELFARIRALSRRVKENSKIILEKVEIDILSKQIFLDSKEIKFSPIEYKIIEFLAKNKGIAKSFLEIYEKIWGNDSDLYFSDSLKVHIVSIRKKLGKDFVSTINGFGYMIG